MQDETVYRYNGMFISVWQLLAQARSTTQAVATATEAQRDFWLAETDLQLALTGTSPGTAPPSPQRSACCHHRGRPLICNADPFSPAPPRPWPPLPSAAWPWPRCPSP
jgi:hypothetical protein